MFKQIVMQGTIIDPKTMGAYLSDCQTYRYLLWRRWQQDGPMVAFVGLNPSTADGTQDDPTTRRLRHFAKAHDFAGFYLLNLFAYRSTDPKELLTASDPIGPENDAYLWTWARKAKTAVACWGSCPRHQARIEEVLALLPPPLLCLQKTKEGFPSHPLYLPNSSTFTPYHQEKDHGKDEK